MWKKINKILHDKNNYDEDPTLKNDVEMYNQLLQSIIRYQKNLLPRKLNYFLVYNKKILFRLFSKIMLKLIIAIVILSSLLLVVMLSFGVNFNFKNVVRKIEKTNLVIYIPSTGDYLQDSILTLEYKKAYKNKDGQYVIFYLNDPSKNYDKWKFALHGIESSGTSNPYEARRPNSQYWGKYQLGTLARSSIHLQNITWDEWKKNKELQEAALKMWIDIIYKDIRNDIKIYDGKFLNGWYITESGLIAMAHNVGPSEARKFLRSNGRYIPKDGSGKDATRFLILGNYNLELNK